MNVFCQRQNNLPITITTSDTSKFQQLPCRYVWYHQHWHYIIICDGIKLLILTIRILCIWIALKGHHLHTWSPLLWRHNGCDGVSNHQPHGCLLNRSFKHRSKKTSKLRVAGLCAGNSPVTGEFPAQMASNAENVSIWWRHHITNF